MVGATPQKSRRRTKAKIKVERKTSRPSSYYFWYDHLRSWWSQSTSWVILQFISIVKPSNPCSKKYYVSRFSVAKIVWVPRYFSGTNGQNKVAWNRELWHRVNECYKSHSFKWSKVSVLQNKRSSPKLESLANSNSIRTTQNNHQLLSIFSWWLKDRG